MSYSQHIQNKKTPQSEPIPGRPDMVQNSAGGFVFQLDDWQRLDRFLVLGAEGNTYYATERKMVIDNAKAVIRCIQADGPRTVKRIRDISFNGRAAKNAPAIFALSLCMVYGNNETKRAIKDVLPEVARYATDLFAFIEETKALRGWGRAFRGAIAHWYLSKEPKQLGYQLIKYRDRNGWTHRDALRLAHPFTSSEDHATLFKYATSGWPGIGPAPHPNPNLVQVWAAERAKQADEGELISLITKYDLPRECIPTQYLKSTAVWEALLQKMPMTAMLRNLATMTRIGLLTHGSEATRIVYNRLVDEQTLKRTRIHPIAVLQAMLTYNSGRSVRGDSSWYPVKRISDGLEQAFYLAFGSIEPANKRTLLALDVSGSMGMGEVGGVRGLSPRLASAVMSMATAKTEPAYDFMAFSTQFIRLDIRATMTLQEAERVVTGLPFGGTDCAQPMMWAQRNKLLFDTFIIYTDSETWAGSIHPSQALQSYIQASGVPAKLVVVGMVSNGFTIADPKSNNMLDVVGFDADAPKIISDFSAGRVE